MVQLNRCSWHVTYVSLEKAEMAGHNMIQHLQQWGNGEKLWNSIEGRLLALAGILQRHCHADRANMWAVPSICDPRLLQAGPERWSERQTILLQSIWKGKEGGNREGERGYGRRERGLKGARMRDENRRGSKDEGWGDEWKSGGEQKVTDVLQLG